MVNGITFGFCLISTHHIYFILQNYVSENFLSEDDFLENKGLKKVSELKNQKCHPKVRTVELRDIRRGRPFKQKFVQFLIGFCTLL